MPALLVLSLDDILALDFLKVLRFSFPVPVVGHSANFCRRKHTMFIFFEKSTARENFQLDL